MTAEYVKSNTIKHESTINSGLDYLNSTSYFMEALDYCLITIKIEHPAGDKHISIDVRKDYVTKPGTVIFQVFVNKERQYSKIVHDWSEHHKLDVLKDNKFIGSMKVVCKIIWLGFTDKSLPSSVINRSSNYSNFYVTAVLSDVMLIVGGGEIPAHKIILAAESSVFLRLFKSNKDMNRIDIENVDPDVMQEVLKFLYTGETLAEDNYELALRMLTVAEKFKIIKLHNYCGPTIFRFVTTDNAIRIICEAEKNNAHRLRKMTLKFIIENIKSIEIQDEYKKLTLIKSELMYEIVDGLRESRAKKTKRIKICFA
ncbi:speckle-type POZ protein B [Microplitis demolitor]|uniref:speckle-type POZ protein B n=1 Tax=Microplitis demolitor TaxID=69319 RepID=UPI0004CCF4F4|nr:speckle-type POZ protein B [Microplitis demolitor]XP_053595166.1 speckle-type POZ protein B [Microplitis demolitor]